MVLAWFDCGYDRRRYAAGWESAAGDDGKVPEVREVDFTAGATGRALQRMLGSPGVRAEQAGADVQNAGWTLSIPIQRRNPRQ
jgi:hypothetical protein